MANDKRYIKLGDYSYKVSWLKSVTESHAVTVMTGAGRDKNQVVNAWKQANGKSVRNAPKAEPKVEKKTTKKTAEKK